MTRAHSEKVERYKPWSIPLALGALVTSTALNYKCPTCDFEATCEESVKRACVNNSEEAPERPQSSNWGTATTSNPTASGYISTSTTL